MKSKRNALRKRITHTVLQNMFRKVYIGLEQNTSRKLHLVGSKILVASGRVALSHKQQYVILRHRQDICNHAKACNNAINYLSAYNGIKWTKLGLSVNTYTFVLIYPIPNMWK